MYGPAAARGDAGRDPARTPARGAASGRARRRAARRADSRANERQIGLGLAALGRPAYINLGHADDLGADRSPDGLRELSHAVLDRAYAAGVRYFDAARSYGLRRGVPRRLAARARAAADVFVGSKWGYTYTADWRIDADEHEVKDLSVGQLRRQLAETREHLGAWLRLYQIHSATIESGVLVRRRRAGRARRAARRPA